MRMSKKSSSKAGSPRILKCNCLNMPIVFCDKSTASTETNERLPTCHESARRFTVFPVY